MLPKPARLNLRKDFKWVASGKKLESRFMALFLKTGENTFPRIGIATSSKVFKKAHKRNRARRLVSSAFESIFDRLPSTINIVALPKQHILEVKSQDVLSDLEEILKNEKIIY